MLKRPKATDTEEDLLALQESFLSSGSKPSASMVSRVGEKRRQQLEEEGAGSKERDVVQLHTVPEGVGVLEAAWPPSKKSKFREKAEQAKQSTQGRSGSDTYEEMERQDRHVTKILAEIQERDTFTVPPVSMAMGHTKHGFPTVHTLDLKSISHSGAPGESSGQEKTAKNSRSLFSQQFESHGAEYFGLELQTPQMNCPVQRDRVEPICLGGRAVNVSTLNGNQLETFNIAEGSLPTSARSSDRGESGTEVTVTSASDTVAVSSGTGGVAATYGQGSDGDSEVLKKQFASTASKTWERFVQSSLISGVGLESVNISKEAAQEEVSRIHRENAERLSGFSEEELLRERERIKQALGPGVLSFLQSRQQQAGQLDCSPGGGQPQRPLSEMMAAPARGGDGGDGREPEGEGGGEEWEAMEQEQRDATGLAAPHGWVHMEVVEREKLQWMTDVSLHPQLSQGSKEVRFSLEGLVVPRDISVPSHLGLHHHGDEPEAGGYTLTELLHLSRSAVLQQRVLSLQILASILLRSSRNEYAGVVEGSLLSSLLEAGLPSLLRYLLDDSTVAVRTAAIQCMHSLLVSPLEEYLLDEYCDCHMGNMLPALRSHDQQPHNSITHDESHDHSEEEETDHEIIQRDVIEGYLRMRLLPRLRYILEVCRPALPTVTDSLQILVRLSRHSAWAASQVVNCPRLMKVVFDDFLPLSWNDDQGPTVAHGRPQVAAMKFIQVICAAGKNLTSHLLSHHKLLDVVLRYAVPHPTELGLPKAEAYAMATSALRVWRVLLHYGMGSEAFRDTYPVFLRQLQLLASSELSSLGPGEGRRVAALLAVAESVVHVAATTPDMLKIKGGGELPPPPIGWAHTSGMLTPLLHALLAWGEGRGNGRQQMPCISNLLHYVGSYYSKLASKLPECPLDVLQQIEALTSGVLGKLPSSSVFTLALQGLRSTSKLANPPSLDGPSTSHSSLPTFTTLPPPPKPALYERPSMQPGDFQQLVQSEVVHFTCTELLLSYVRLCLACVKLHKGVIDKVTEIFNIATFHEYLEAVVQNPARKQCSSFEFGELYFLYCSVKLFVIWLELSDISSLPEGLVPLCHHATFRLLTQLPPGMEVFLYNLMSTVVLHPKLLCEPTHVPTSLITQDIDNLTLREHPETVTIATEASDSAPPISAILAEARRRLGSIRSVYLTAIESGIYTEEQLSKSRSRLLRYPLTTDSLLLPPHTAPLLPADWVMLPAMVEYSKTVRSDSAAEELSSEAVSMVTHTLYFLLLLEHHCPRVLCDLPPSAKLARLMCVFLVGNDLFLEREIHCCLSVLLRLYCKEEVQRVLDFDAPIPGLASFYDFYTTLLKQYAAVSYGDRLFASFVLLPLQQRFGSQLRRALWEEYPAVLRVLALPIAQLPVSINRFLHPTETDTELVELYMKAVATGTVRPQWSPVLYLTAVHHLHFFMFNIRENEEPSPLQLKLLQGTLQLRNEEIKEHLLLYNGVTEESRLGFSVAPILSEAKRTLLTSLQHEHSSPVSHSV